MLSLPADTFWYGSQLEGCGSFGSQHACKTAASSISYHLPLLLIGISQKSTAVANFLVITPSRLLLVVKRYAGLYLVWKINV